MYSSTFQGRLVEGLIGRDGANDNRISVGSFESSSPFPSRPLGVHERPQSTVAIDDLREYGADPGQALQPQDVIVLDAVRPRLEGPNEDLDWKLMYPRKEQSSTPQCHQLTLYLAH